MNLLCPWPASALRTTHGSRWKRDAGGWRDRRGRRHAGAPCAGARRHPRVAPRGRARPRRPGCRVRQLRCDDQERPGGGPSRRVEPLRVGHHGGPGLEHPRAGDARVRARCCAARRLHRHLPDASRWCAGVRPLLGLLATRQDGARPVARAAGQDQHRPLRRGSRRVPRDWPRDAHAPGVPERGAPGRGAGRARPLGDTPRWSARCCSACSRQRARSP